MNIAHSQFCAINTKHGICNKIHFAACHKLWPTEKEEADVVAAERENPKLRRELNVHNSSPNYNEHSQPH